MTGQFAPNWLLPHHVHVCALADAAVLLDLRADRYHGLTGRQSAALSLVVQGWPDVPNLASAPADVKLAEALAQDLACQDLLTQDDARGKSAGAVVLPRVEEQLQIWEGADWSAIRASDVRAFARAWTSATLQLKLCSLARIVARVERRRRLGGSPFEVSKARTLVHTFRALRPWVYTTLDRCLLDSLVLIEFLALHGQFPTWVIGVRTGPFAAHSWVQHEHYVLNGGPTYVRAYTPILAV
jgi:hypothetical protein